MKKYLLRTICLSLLLFATQSLLAKETANANLVKNGGFETVNLKQAISHGATGHVANWTPLYYPTQGFKAGVSNNAASGKNAVYLENHLGKKTLSWLSDFIPVGKKEKLVIGFSIKTEKLQAGSEWYKPGVMIIFYDKDQKRLCHRDVKRFGSEIKEWTTITEDFTVPNKDNIAYMRLGLVISYCKGKVFFDDVAISREVKKKLLIQATNAGNISILTGNTVAQAVQTTIFPTPKVIKKHNGLADISNVAADWSNLPKSNSVAYMKQQLDSALKKSSSAAIPFVFNIDENINKNSEYYKLTIAPNGITLVATSESGIFYGLQTFLLLAKQNNRLACMEIEDWPDFSKRGFITGSGSLNTIKQLVPYKFNIYWWCGGNYNCRQWFRPMTQDEKINLAKLAKQAVNCKMPLHYGLRPGFGKLELHFSDNAHVKAILDKYTAYYNAGVRNFYLAYDDLFNIGRSKLSFKDDIARFKNIGNAHYFLADKVYRHLKSLNLKNRLYIVPMYYYDPTFYSIDEKAYLKSLSTLPADVEFINCGTLTTTGVKNAIKITGRKPFFWSNFMAQFEEAKVRPNVLTPLSFKRPANITEKMNGFMFVLWPDHTMMKELFSDFLWNADNFDPDKSFAINLRKHMGKGSDILAQFVEFKKSMASYPFIGQHKDEILLLTKNVIKNIDSWRLRINKLPKQKQLEIIKELDAMIATYKMLLKDLALREYPINIATTNGGKALKEVVRNFVLPMKTWHAGMPNLAKAKTMVKVGYDNKFLYFQFICEEPQFDKLRARHSKHDSMVFTDDCVEFFLQPPNATKYYHVAINSLGAVYDSYGNDKKWDSKAEVKVEKFKEAWLVNCKIPLKALNVTDLKGQAWKVNFMREKHSGKKEFSSAFPVLKRFHESERLWKVIFN